MKKRGHRSGRNPLVERRSQRRRSFSCQGEYGAYPNSPGDNGFVTPPDMSCTREVDNVWPVDNTGALRHVGVD